MNCELRVVQRTAEVRGDVIMVHQLAFMDVAGGMTDGVAVLDDVLADCDVAEGELMARRNAWKVLQGHSDRVGRVDLKERLQGIKKLIIKN